MVIVAQLVRALVCGSRGRRFEPGLSPKPLFWRGFSVYKGARLAQDLKRFNQTKPRSDVYIIQILTKISGCQAGKYSIGSKLFCEI
jgi:hypothetical protein